MKKILAFSLSILLLIGCSSTIPLGDTPENSLDWSGIYSGTLPCADCEGINTKLTLNQDNTFILESTYLSSVNGIKTQFTPPKQTGHFEWDKKNLSVIHLVKSKDGNVSYFIGESHVLLCDQDGNPIRDTELNYKLKQVEVF